MVWCVCCMYLTCVGCVCTSPTYPSATLYLCNIHINININHIIISLLNIIIYNTAVVKKYSTLDTLRNRILIGGSMQFQVWDLKNKELLLAGETPDKSCSFFHIKMKQETVVGATSAAMHIWNINGRKFPESGTNMLTVETPVAVCRTCVIYLYSVSIFSTSYRFMCVCNTYMYVSYN